MKTDCVAEHYQQGKLDLLSTDMAVAAADYVTANLWTLLGMNELLAVVQCNQPVKHSKYGNTSVRTWNISKVLNKDKLVFQSMVHWTV